MDIAALDDTMGGMKVWLRKFVDAWHADRDDRVQWLCALPTLVLFIAAGSLLSMMVGLILDHYLHFPPWATFVAGVLGIFLWFYLGEKHDIQTPQDWINEHVLKSLTPKEHIVFSGCIALLLTVGLAFKTIRDFFFLLWKHAVMDGSAGSKD